jgi:hypothetical protein
VVDAPNGNGNGNGRNGNGQTYGQAYGAINNAITTILVALFVLLIPIIYSLNQSVARLQSEHDSFVAEQAVEHETIELIRRQLGEATVKIAALEVMAGLAGTRASGVGKN